MSGARANTRVTERAQRLEPPKHPQGEEQEAAALRTASRGHAAPVRLSTVAALRSLLVPVAAGLGAIAASIIAPVRASAEDSHGTTRTANPIAYRIPYTALAVARTDSSAASKPRVYPDGTARIPAELLEGLLLLTGRASGEGRDTTGAFVLDTGAGFLALDHDLALHLSLVDGGTRTEPVGMAQRPLRRLVLGDQTRDQVQPVLTIDGAIIRRVTDRPVLGLLGARLYDDRALQVDYLDREIRLLPTRSHSANADSAGPGTETAGGPRVAAAIRRSHASLASAISPDAMAVPFTLAGDGKILVDARVGVSRFASSRPLRLILDTGATKTVLFRGPLRALGVDVARWPTLCGLSVPTLFGAPSACVVRLPRLTLEAMAFDAGGDEIQSTAARTAKAEDDRPDAAATTAARLPAGARRVRPAVAAMLGRANDDMKKEESGAAQPHRTAAAPGSAEPAESSAADADGAPAPRETTLRAAEHDAILMDSELADVLSNVVGERVHGLLGYTFLRHYRVTVDYPNRVAWFEHAADPDPRPFEYSHPGIQLERDGATLRIVAVAEGSPAAAARIAVGDTLVSVDGQPAAGQDLSDIARLLEGEPGSRLMLGVAGPDGRRTVAVVRRRLL